MAVSNTKEIYHGISTLEITGIFYKIGNKLLWYLNPRKSMGFTIVIYHGILPWYFYNIGSRSRFYKLDRFITEKYFFSLHWNSRAYEKS